VLTNAQPSAWSSDAYRHIPGGSTVDVLDFRVAGQIGDNRWNVAGERTLYVASDRAVTIAEFARHYRERRSPATRREAVSRQVFRLRVELQQVLDLRNPQILASLSIAEAPYCFLDPVIARATARHIRSATTTQAIIVPSMAFLDAPDRWVAVLFLEKLPQDPRQFITAVEPVGTFHLEL
jgi:RES domain-containing protein